MKNSDIEKMLIQQFSSGRKEAMVKKQILREQLGHKQFFSPETLAVVDLSKMQEPEKQKYLCRHLLEELQTIEEEVYMLSDQLSLECEMEQLDIFIDSIKLLLPELIWYLQKTLN